MRSPGCSFSPTASSPTGRWAVRSDFERDVFDAVPGDDAYRPLRAVQLVTWSDGVEPTELGSVDAILDAVADGQITIEEPGIVVNMPIIEWPGGTR